jgi:flavin-dependent dehydrogenase
MNQRFDALVIGGGPAGSASALLLARAGLSVALVESQSFPRRKVCGEFLSATNWPILHRLGIADALQECAGPPVRDVGLFAGMSVTRARLPECTGANEAWGRAIGREDLDTLLLRQAARAGVLVRQPWSAVEFLEEGDTFLCKAVGKEAGQTEWLRAGLIVAAHGSWQPGALPSQPERRPAQPGDLLAFKAHFRGADLPEGLMPLLVFPGGYGGMVHCAGGRVNLSCCIRRDVLRGIRAGSAGAAGDAVLGHIVDSCLGVRQALGAASREGPWLAAGPIRPGTRLRTRPGIFAVGNAAGEAHPAIAEGISMALQSALLLSQRLCAWRRAGGVRGALPGVAVAYRQAWQRAFGPRLLASSLLAHWAMRPGAVAGILPAVRRFPAILTWGARWSGKSKLLADEFLRQKVVCS